MRLFIQTPDLQGLPSEAAMEHNGQVIIWNAGIFDRLGGSVNTYDIFEHINGYWAAQPKSTQDRIFEIYKAIRSQFDVLIAFDVVQQIRFGWQHDVAVEIHPVTY
jgi:hypothetical protein